ncbi:PREDICTED: aspartic [Prunus dulcis]|uniref:PREDICTED: aspartic n=1 Tax=Prunus dulcis TaxID=3755 RepID=A0A5E4G8F5_PRUDU|nr:PREDICTED: aspartic [Prunus dulcis]
MDILFERALALKACVLSREAMQTRAMWLAFLHLILSVSIAVQAPVGSLFKAWYLVAPLTAKRCPLLAIVIKYLVSWTKKNNGGQTMGATSSFIRFGADIEQRPDLSVTELKRNNNIVLYYINLIGISVNGYMLNIPEQEFEIKKDGSGGSIIDSGAAFSHIRRRAAHDSLLRALEAVFAGYGDTVKRVPSGDVPFELCYEVLKQEAFQGFPVITFHLQNNADIILDAESAFLIGKEDCFRSS